MTDIFNEARVIAYDPEEARNRRGGKSYSKACENCYLRKVRCPLGYNGGPCDNCLKHRVACRPRIRRRKADSRAGARPEEQPEIGSNENTSRASTPQAMSQTSLPTAAGTNAGSLGDDAANQGLFVDRRSHQIRGLTTPASPPYDRYKGSAFLSRSVIFGDDFPGIDTLHNEDGKTAHNMPLVDLQALQHYGSLELPSVALRQSLVDAFFERCWAWSPVLDQVEQSDRTKSSLVLLQAVLLAGSVMRPSVCSEEMIGTFYRRVKALIHARYEHHPLVHVAATVLLQWYTPTPPKDISTDLPRYWMTNALALAQQMGLHREAAQNDRDRNLRRRIWWSIYTCDCFSAAAEGRPRLINLEDCSVSPPTVHDFPRESERTALVFVCFVGISGILADLCQILARRGEIFGPDRVRIENRLKVYIRDFPEQLRLYSLNCDSYRPFDFQAAQLHIHFLTTVVILYRPKSLSFLSERNIPSFVAAGLCLEIFEAVHLREMVPYLATIFSWHLLVIAVAQISWSRVKGLREQCNAGLDSIENILGTFVSTRPATANNLRNIRAVRKALVNRDVLVPTQMPSPISQEDATEALNFNTGSDNTSSTTVPEVLQWYGPKVANDFKKIAETFRRHCALQEGRGPCPEQNHAAQEHSQDNRVQNLEAFQLEDSNPHDDFGDGSLFGDVMNDFRLENNLWMRDLVEEFGVVYDAETQF